MLKLSVSANSSLATRNDRTASTDARSRKGAKRYWLACVFALALSVRLWFAFADGHSAIVFSCDASEYLRDARGLAQIIESKESSQVFSDSLRTFLDSSAKESGVRKGFEPVRELAIAGPVFPLFLLASYAAFGLQVSAAAWQAPVLLQCLLTAGTCVLIALIGKAAWGRGVGITAGIIAALYPGFVVNSIRMYSESFSCFLLCAVVALTIPVVRGHGLFHSVSAGVCLAFLQLTRSIMVLVTGLTFVLTAWLSPGRSKILRLGGLLAGLAIVFAPWLMFQELAFGKSAIVVDRVGHYNLFIGTNISTNGYLSYPYPDGAGIEKKSYGTLIAAQAKESPERFIRLMLDKPLRLFKFPWNDFRTPIGPFGMGLQVLFHQVMLAFAAVGVILGLLDKSDINQRVRLRILLAGLWAMHMIYIFFITVPRYNLTAMPFVMLFSSAGAVLVFKALFAGKTTADRSETEKPILSTRAACILLGALALSLWTARQDSLWLALLPSSVVVALVVASVVKAIPLSAFFCVLWQATGGLGSSKALLKPLCLLTGIVVVSLCSMPLRSHGRFFETSIGTGVKQTIRIAEENRPAVLQRDCYLLVDCNNWQTLGNGAKIFVNQVQVDAPLIPLMPFAQTLRQSKVRGVKDSIEQHYLECEDIYRSLATASGGSNLDLRQWFAMPLSRGLMQSAVASNDSVLNIELHQTGSGIFGVRVDAEEQNLRIPSVSRYSWEKAFYGVENEHGFTDSRYDDKIAVAARNADNTAGGVEPNIRLLVAPPTSRTSEQHCLTSASAQGARLEIIGETVPTYNQDSVWIASIRGRLNSIDETTVNVPLSFVVVFESIDKNGARHRYRAPWVPASMALRPGSNQFRFALPFQPDALPGKLHSLSVECRAGEVAGSSDFFAVHGPASSHIKPAKLDDNHVVDSLTLDLYALPVSPIANGYEVL